MTIAAIVTRRERDGSRMSALRSGKGYGNATQTRALGGAGSFRGGGLGRCAGRGNAASATGTAGPACRGAVGRGSGGQRGQPAVGGELLAERRSPGAGPQAGF